MFSGRVSTSRPARCPFGAGANTTGRQDRIELIAGRSFEEVPAHTVMLFDMGEDRLDGGASSELFVLLLVGGSLGQNRGIAFVSMAPIALVVHEGFDLLTDQILKRGIGRIESFGEGMPIVRVALMGLGMKDEALFGAGDEGGLVPELIAFVGFALGDTGHIGFMEAVELVLAVAGLL